MGRAVKSVGRMITAIPVRFSVAKKELGLGSAHEAHRLAVAGSSLEKRNVDLAAPRDNRAHDRTRGLTARVENGCSRREAR